MADKLPTGMEELYGYLGANKPHGQHSEEHKQEPEAPAVLPVVDLPITPQKDTQVEPEDSPKQKAEKRMIEHDRESHVLTVNVSSALGKFEKLSFKNLFKASLPYIAIFATLLFFYLVVFTNFSVSSWFSGLIPHNQSDNTAQAQTFQVPSEQRAAYNAWIQSYFFDVTDPKIIDPSTDISGNGLTNYQKFLLGLNPKLKDSMGLGITDTEALISGIDPLTGKPLTETQKQQVASIIDLEGVANKLALQTVSQSSQVAGASTAENRSNVFIDTNVNAELEIPSLNLTVPLIWSKDVDGLLDDLQNGVVHYPGTAIPGEIGTSYISGHSSNYSWAKGDYNKVFAKLNDLKQYDSVSIKATQIGGKPVVFHYVVTAKDVFKPDDQKQFANIGKSTIALSTCWPIGTTSKRLVVFAQLSQIDK